MAVGVPPGLEVVAGPHRVEAEALGGEGEVEEPARAELLGRGLVSESQHVVLPWRTGMGARFPRDGPHAGPVEAGAVRAEAQAWAGGASVPGALPPLVSSISW